MASGPVEQGLEQIFRAYGRILRTTASVLPGEGAERLLDNAAEVLRRALDLPELERIEASRQDDPPVESAAAATPSSMPGVDLEESGSTLEFDAVAAEPQPAASFSYTIARPGESGRKGTIFATYESEIAAPIERCWDVAADVVNAVEWTPLLLEARVAPENTTEVPTIFDTVGDAKVRKAKAKLRFEFDRPRGMRWEQLEGDQKFLIAAWEFDQLDDDRVRASYLVETDLGRAMSMVVRGPVRDWVTDMLTRGSVEGLKATVE